MLILRGNFHIFNIRIALAAAASTVSAQPEANGPTEKVAPFCTATSNVDLPTTCTRQSPLPAQTHPHINTIHHVESEDRWP